MDLLPILTIGSPGDLGSSEEKNRRGSADRRVLAEERQGAGLAVDSVSCDGIRSLVARIEVVPCWLDVEAARIVAASPFLSCKCEKPALADGKPADAVMQTVGSIEESSVSGNQNFRSKIRALEWFWQCGNSLL